MTSSEPLIPGRTRKTIARTGPTNNLPVAHVSLGRTWQRRNKVQTGQLHIVVQNGDEWSLLCSGARATRSFRGKPAQAGCSACRGRAGAA